MYQQPFRPFRGLYFIPKLEKDEHEGKGFFVLNYPAILTFPVASCVALSHALTCLSSLSSCDDFVRRRAGRGAANSKNWSY